MAKSLAVGALVGGCFSPDLQLAECIACPDGVCPGDLLCVENHCVDPGRATACEASSGAAGESGRGGNAALGGAAGAGRAGAGGVASAGAGGTRTISTSGGSGDAGAGTVGDGGADELSINGLTSTGVVCTGTDSSFHLTVTGGQRPYRWSLSGGDSAFTLEAAGAEADLNGAPEQPGVWNLTVTVLDKNGRMAEREWEVPVHETPSVRTSEVPSVCPSELYSAPLEAEGGEPSLQTWSTDLSPQTGLGVVGDHLEGHFLGAQPGATQLEFTVTVEAEGCVSAPASLTLDLESPTAAVCPAIDVASAPSGTQLPKACLGNDYRRQLLVRRGRAPYVWQATSEPPGLVFDGSQQILSGVASAPGALTVQVQDGTGRTVETSYSIGVREKCWFAYVSTETEPSHLELLDPLLGNRRSFADPANSAAVTDFQFSPDGQFLAYRSGDVSFARVAIVKLATWQEQLFDLHSVTHYAWSPDSSVLALAFDSAGSRSLGAINVAHVDALAAGAAPGSILFSELEPTPAHVDSELTWFAPSQLGFLSTSTNPIQQLSKAELGASGFVSPNLIQDNVYVVGTQLRAAASGLYVVPQLGAILFYGADGSSPALHDNIVIGGTGLYVGRAQEHELRVFHANDSSFSKTAKAPFTVAGCDDLLAWAGARERIACAHQLAAGNELVIFDLDPATNELRLLSDVRGDFDYPQGAQVQRRRLFSPKGDRFAFTSDDALHVATLEQGTPRVDFNVPLPVSTLAPNNAFAELAFSPDGARLLQHRGRRLSFFDLSDRALGEVELSSALAPSLRCEEDFRDQNGGWCGVERPQAPFRWSPESDLAAYQTAENTLEIYDFTWLARRLFTSVPVHEGCTAGCVSENQFGFQP